MKLNLGFLLCSLWATASALYDHNSDVIDLTDTNFNYKVTDSSDLWIVEFYAPWCGHCQSLAPEYKKMATALKGIVKVGGVNADEHKSIAGQFGIKGFPTIKVFGLRKSSPEDYQGPRTADGIIEEAFKQLRKLVNNRMGRSGGDGSSGGAGGGGGKQGDPKDVVELTDSNFEATVLQSEDMWLVEFFAPWCGHCKNLAPQWASAATQLKGKVKLGAVDATVHTVFSSRYGVQGYPTIKMFPAGKKDSPVEFDGGRTASDIVSWALDKLAANIPPPEIRQVLDNKMLNDSCAEYQLCIVAILPHILDCQSNCRNAYLKTLQQLGEKFKKNLWGWVWSEAGAQMALEDALGLGGFGYPAMAAVNARKMKYAWLKGAFSYDGINEFLRELAVGRGSTVPVKGATLPEIVKIEAWDGQDGKLEVEEDIDVDDVELEPLGKDEL